MNRESLVFAFSGILFGVMIGWIIGSQQAATSSPQTPAETQASAPQPTSGNSGQTTAPLDETRAQNLKTAANEHPQDAGIRVELANLYFDAERYADAITWYQEALKIDSKDVNASTDLGVSYYYTNQPDKALEQFAHSLSLDPRHPKTLLNLGIVRAFGKQDLQGAAEAWQKVLEVAPDSAEARAAKQALDGLRSAHPDSGPASSTPKGEP